MKLDHIVLKFHYSLKDLLTAGLLAGTDANTLRFPLLLKPNSGGFGAGILRFNDARQIEATSYTPYKPYKLYKPYTCL